MGSEGGMGVWLGIASARGSGVRIEGEGMRIGRVVYHGREEREEMEGEKGKWKEEEDRDS